MPDPRMSIILPDLLNFASSCTKHGVCKQFPGGSKEAGYLQACVTLAFPMGTEVAEMLSTEEGERFIQSQQGFCERSASSPALTQQLLNLDGTSHQSIFCHCNKTPKAGHLVKKRDH